MEQRLAPDIMAAYPPALPCERAGQQAQAHWDAIAKPLGSLGLLEQAVVRIAALRGDHRVRLDRRAAIVMCADNGVVAEGVSQSGPEVTALVAGNMVSGRTSVCCIARQARCEVWPIDLGMLAPVAGVRDRRVMAGTHNIRQGPAMSRDQALTAIYHGIDLVRQARDLGYDILATGEMGIGNTTTAAAICCALLGEAPELMTGRGAGLSDRGLVRKQQVIRQALAVNRPDPADPLDVLAKVGGLDIAGLTGVFIGGAPFPLPVLIDGFISSAAALVASGFDAACVQAMLASHVSAEPASALVLAALGLKPLISAEMRLGEGSGAVAALPLLDMALAVYNEMATFDDIGLAAYVPQEGE